MAEETELGFEQPIPSGTGASSGGHPVIPETPLWRIRLRLFWRGFKTNAALFAENKIGLIGLGVIIFFALMAVSYPVLTATVWDKTAAGVKIYDPITGYDPYEVRQPAPPSAAHLLGTDALGRDVLSQILYSTASEFALGLIAALVTVFIATTIGAIAAYYGGIIDTLFMRIADIAIMTPLLTILIVFSGLFDIKLIHLAFVIGILSGFGGTAVVIKSQALTIKVRTYIEAARVAGGSDAHIIFNHVVPNLLPLSFLYMMFTVTTAIFSEAVLSYLGLLNIRMSWGLIIHTTETAGYLLDLKRWWLIFPPSLSITALCAAFYLVGRALDEIVNPRLRKR